LLQEMLIVFGVVDDWLLGVDFPWRCPQMSLQISEHSLNSVTSQVGDQE